MNGQKTEKMAAVPHRQTGVTAMLTGFVPSRQGIASASRPLHRQLGGRRAGSSVCHGNKGPAMPAAPTRAASRALASIRSTRFNPNGPQTK